MIGIVVAAVVAVLDPASLDCANTAELTVAVKSSIDATTIIPYAITFLFSNFELVIALFVI